MLAPTPYFADRGCHVRIFEEARALRENLQAANLKLAACDQFLLDQVFARGNTAGDRYNAASMATLDRSRA